MAFTTQPFAHVIELLAGCLRGSLEMALHSCECSISLVFEDAGYEVEERSGIKDGHQMIVFLVLIVHRKEPELPPGSSSASYEFGEEIEPTRGCKEDNISDSELD